MADLCAVTAPLALRCADGTRKLVAACFRHPLGLRYLEPFWHQRTPDESAHLIRGELHGESAHLIRGELHGEGPWRIGDCVINVFGCHGTDPDLAQPFSRWRDDLASCEPGEYPSPAQIRDIARRLGAPS